MKRDYLEKAGIGIPGNTRLVTADFERESVGDVLSRQGITPKEPVFFSWLGVTMYLNEPAIQSTLAAMAAFPEGSEVTLTYLHPADRHLLAESVERLGEPYVSCFDEPAMESLLRDAGFRHVAFLSTADAHDRYYGRGDMALTVPGRTGLVSAVR
jgi:methyltransferase (TIGR00027 family)